MVIYFHNPVRKIALILAFLFVVYSYWSYFNSSQRIQGRLAQLILLIDPGHGGVDGGTQDQFGNLEKDINLQIALKVREQLVASGLKIIMTRENDTDLAPFRSGQRGRHRRDLLSRIEKARCNNCLFLISIHCDSSVARERRGPVAFYNYRSDESKQLALLPQDELNKVQQAPAKAAPGKYLIIRQSGVNSVLLEVGFLSNPEEAKLLQDPDYQQQLAAAIAKGILKYCQKYVPAKPSDCG